MASATDKPDTPGKLPKPKASGKPNNARSFRAPKGTRDAYPIDALKRRYITQAWRNASIRHGFDEIEGPTFEHLELYTQKSGDEIVSQLFSFRRAGGDDDYALRPEFTPTLARMYAARANSLPTPTKWFTAGPYFRAEKPQRGRLREFLQWNCDIMGDDSADADAELTAVCVSLLEFVGLSPDDAEIKLNNRRFIASWALEAGIPDVKLDAFYQVLDGIAKRSETETRELVVRNGIELSSWDEFWSLANELKSQAAKGASDVGQVIGWDAGLIADHTLMLEAIRSNGILRWCKPLELGVVRGLAYYTGMVFEVIAEGERAICGGGRYDNLIELFGGPPTPAVGFGMGDVVLSLLLEDKGLMPDGKDLLDAVSAPQASARPDAFLITADEKLDPIVKQTVAALRAGTESDAWLGRADRKPWDADRYTTRPLHARRSYKSTRNIGKLLKDATNQHARHAVIIQSAETCHVKNLDTGEQREGIALADLETVLGGAEVTK